MIQAAGSGARPVIVLNKSNLCDDLHAVIASAESVTTDIAILPLSAKDDLNLDALKAYIKPGETIAFLGSSGVGKSSLVNRLMGEAHLKTGEVREDDSRGRHTTSHRELILLTFSF